MRKRTVLFIVLNLILCLAYTINPDSIESRSFNEQPEIYTSTDSVTRIAPLQQEYGMGHLYAYWTYPVQYHCDDASDEAMFGDVYGARHFTWAIWDMSVIPSDAEIVMVEIEHDLEPLCWEDGTRYCYRQLDTLLLELPECADLFEIIEDGLVYLNVEMGTLPGIRRYDLQVRALADVAAAVLLQDYFSIAFTRSLGSIHLAKMPGWNSGGPELIVTWRRTVATESKSWGAIKAISSHD